MGDVKVYDQRIQEIATKNAKKTQFPTNQF